MPSMYEGKAIVSLELYIQIIMLLKSAQNEIKTFQTKAERFFSLMLRERAGGILQSKSS
jgi:hypothetical protein